MLTVDDYMALPARRPDLRVAYGEQADQFAELYLPAGAGPHPVVALTHGGCWRARYGLAPLGPLCEALRDEGFAVWSMEYRRIGGAGGWPATFADAAAGLDALRGVGAPIDLGRVVTAGHSAGGQLALWLAARRRLPLGQALWTVEPLPVRGVIALAALGDLAAAARRALCGTAVEELLGGPPAAVPERYALASPAELLPLGLRQRHIVGAADAIVPPDYVEALAVAATAAGDDVTVTILPDAGHFEVVVPVGPAWMALRTALREILA